jgi:hypothetical protein
MIKNPIMDTTDNCLLCKHAEVQENQLAKMARAYGWISLAGRLNRFPVVKCKLSGGKYVANPLNKPGWCIRGR